MSVAAMTKKKSGALPAPGVRAHLWLGLQLVLSLCVISSVLALLRIRAQAAAELRSVESFESVRKIAFLFLARSNLPLDLLWHAFFQNADEGSFSLYVHSEPGFVFNKSTTRSHFFYDRQIGDSVKVLWGESSMIEAERLLLRAALNDPTNQYFVLLSDSCVPLYNFSYVYKYLSSSPKSFVDSFLDVKEGRYNPKMSPTIPKDKWRKGSQWITLVRRHAEVLVADDVVFPVFKKYCKRRPALDPDAKRKNKSIVQKEHNCIPDEHYVQTLLSMSNLEDELERRTLTYTSWNQSKNKMERRSWHPVKFEYPTASPQHIKKIKDIDHVYYEMEFRTEWCQSNATFMPCFLFARKFSQGAAMRLLSEGLVGPFDPAFLLLNA